MKSFSIYWLPVISLAAAIFIQSSFPSPQMVPRFPFSDKLLHGIVYGLLAALCYRALRRASLFRDHGLAKLVFFAVTMATLNGVSDEWHQSFVAERQADIFDLLADFVGSWLGAIGYAYFAERLRGVGDAHSLIDKLARFL